MDEEQINTTGPNIELAYCDFCTSCELCQFRQICELHRRQIRADTDGNWRRII